MKHTRILALVLCLCMVVTMFAACGDGAGAGQAGTGSYDNEQYIDPETGEIINIGSDKTLAVTPEEVGKLANPVVRGVEAWLTADREKEHVTWKKDAYGLIYDCEKCNGDQRMTKWVTAFVSGDAYDVIWMSSGNFPTIAQKGLLQPLDKIMPVYDETYFKQAVTDAFTWKDRVYGVNCFEGIKPYGIMYNATLFDNSGVDTPLELYNAGNWNWTTFESTIKEFHSVNGTADDVYGLAGSYDYLVNSAIVTNGSEVITYTSTGAELALGAPKTVEALNWTNKIRKYNINDKARDQFLTGHAAMYMERQQQLNSVRKESPDYVFEWAPFPQGPNGTGATAGPCDAWGIGKGAKNIAGALAWIAADAYHEEYFKANPIEIGSETRTEEEFALDAKMQETAIMNNYSGFGISLWKVIEDAEISGVQNAVEKYSPQFQAKINEMLGIQAEQGSIDFEDIGVIDFNTTDGDYPFVNVIGDDKVTYGTADAPSLKIDLTGMTEFGTILHTKPELYKIQQGGQYKVTFKLYCEVDPGVEKFAIAARTTDDLTTSVVPENWLTFKAGEATDVEVFLNVNNSFEGDLAIVLLGAATEANPDLNIVIDDFHVELVAGA